MTVTLEIEAEAPDGVPDEVVRIVSENSRALKYGVRGGMRPARRRSWLGVSAFLRLRSRQS